MKTHKLRGIFQLIIFTSLTIGITFSVKAVEREEIIISNWGFSESFSKAGRSFSITPKIQGTSIKTIQVKKYDNGVIHTKIFLSKSHENIHANLKKYNIENHKNSVLSYTYNVKEYPQAFKAFNLYVCLGLLPMSVMNMILNALGIIAPTANKAISVNNSDLP